MKYQIGVKYPFIIVHREAPDRNWRSDPTGFMAGLYVPWCQQLIGIQVVMLECREVHKVYSHWVYHEHLDKGTTPPEEPTYNGYVFHQEGVEYPTWHLDYPAHSSGGGGRREVRLHTPRLETECEDDYKRRIHELVESDQLAYLNCAFGYMETVKRGTTANYLTTIQQGLLADHLKEVVALVEKESGRKVSIEPHMVGRTPGCIAMASTLLDLIVAKVPGIEINEASDLKALGKQHGVEFDYSYGDFNYIHPNVNPVHLTGWYDADYAT